MPRQNDFNAPTCPKCCKTMAHNGYTKLGKTRWRCKFCGYNETENSLAHNSNTRTGYGIMPRDVITKITFENHIKNNARTIAKRHGKLGDKCELCYSTDDLERHHPDYNRPLYFRTDCTTCHAIVNTLQRQGYSEDEINCIIADKVFTGVIQVRS